jgi:hypothetical protein
MKEIIFNKELVIEDDKLNTVTIEVIHQELDDSSTTLKSKKEFKRSFEITRFRRAWPELSSGIFYSQIEYNTFSAGTSATPATSVIEKTTKTQPALAALFYNYVFDTGLHPLYPFLQAGVGTGKEYPCLLTGGGFRLVTKNAKRISLSSGAVFSFNRELDKFGVGESIAGGQAAIDEDVRYSFGKKLGFYFGVAWKIN